MGSNPAPADRLDRPGIPFHGPPRVLPFRVLRGPSGKLRGESLEMYIVTACDIFAGGPETLLAQSVVLAQQGGGGQGGGIGQLLLPVAGVVAIWWFLVIGPQRKADKLRNAKIEAMRKGDKVLTRAGILGVVSRVKDDVVVLRIDTDGKVHVPFQKTAIEDVVKSTAGGGDKS